MFKLELTLPDIPFDEKFFGPQEVIINKKVYDMFISSYSRTTHDAGGYTVAKSLDAQAILYPKKEKNTMTENSKDKAISFQPLGERILVKPDEVEESVSGGIIIPTTTKEKPMEGVVISIGPGKLTQDGKTHVPQVNIGDRVLFGKYAGTEIELNKDTYLVISYDDLLGVVKVK